MVQSASVEEGMSKQQQPVPIEEIIPPDLQTESPRSVPLPPPIIPETEDSTHSPVSEASSGYISTSISTVTLSDVYTLSWDLPPSSGSRSDDFEVVPDEEEEDNKVTCPESCLVDQSGLQESLLVSDDKEAEEMTDSPPPKPENTPSDSNLSQQESNLSPSVQLKESNSVGESDLPCQTKEKQDSTISPTEPKQFVSLEPLEDSLLVRENETKQTEVSQTDHSKPETPQTEEFEPAATDKTEAELSLHYETQPCAEEGQSETIVPQPLQPKQDQTTVDNAQDPAPNLIPVVPEVLVSAPASSGDLVLLTSSDEQATLDVPNPYSAFIPTSSTTTAEVQQEAPANASTKATTAPDPSVSSVLPSKPDVSVANPFKIQKVKSSDLKSFQRILGEDEDEPAQVDQASSLGAGLNLSVPMESLEIISDSEEGDSAANTVLPDWLKEGEFVTVGTNKTGTVRYVGPTDFAEGNWVGVELEVPAGKNDGSVGGKQYFHCNPGYGVLVRPHRVSRGGAKRRRQQQKRRSANLSGSSPNLAALTALAKGEGGGASTGRSRGENRKSWNT